MKNKFPTPPFRAIDKTNSAYRYIVVTKVYDNFVLAYTTFADGYSKYEREINIEDIDIIGAHKCNPDKFNRCCQICGGYCG